MSYSVVFELPPDCDPEEQPQEAWRDMAAQQLEIPMDDIAEVQLVRISFDARARHMEWRISATVYMQGEEVPAPPSEEAPRYDKPADDAAHVVVIGSGPAGLFAALRLVEKGVKVTVCERGKEVQARRRDIADLNRGEEAEPESNYAFGEGGAGTFSDGKLYTRSSKRGSVNDILEMFVAHGAPARILSAWRPHIGSNLLPKVVSAMTETIRAAGSEVLFDARVDEILTDGAEHPTTKGVRLSDNREIEAQAVVLATGHSALDALKMAQRAGATLEAKGFAMGVRVEHEQEWLDQVQYRGMREDAGLPASFYEVNTQIHERGVFSFCMCPGGWIVPSQTTPGTLVVNGMSLSKRDSPYANGGLVVSIEPKDWCGKRGWRWGFNDLMKKAAEVSDHPMLHESIEDPRGGNPIEVEEGRLPVHPAIDPFFGVRLQLALEILAAHAGGGDGKAPSQRCDLFVAAEGEVGEALPTSYLPGVTPTDLGSILPRGIANRLREAMTEFDEHLPGFAGASGQLLGVETRTSSPVRILRGNETLESDSLSGLYPCGEGAGYAGGIVSAALDGSLVAAKILEQIHVNS
ncbi:MAG: NAD(P)/FAD-dependent oxidoreductase [Planctomycetota bacterium]|nr:NAD(P)/FAD-dependent oxidoreductase [Planctomycetota bacterium]